MLPISIDGKINTSNPSFTFNMSKLFHAFFSQDESRSFQVLLQTVSGGEDIRTLNPRDWWGCCAISRSVRIDADDFHTERTIGFDGLDMSILQPIYICLYILRVVDIRCDGVAYCSRAHDSLCMISVDFSSTTTFELDDKTISQYFPTTRILSSQFTITTATSGYVIYIYVQTYV